ncbi:hypothetical protein OROMI_008007 [Orobanche minor]
MKAPWKRPYRYEKVDNNLEPEKLALKDDIYVKTRKRKPGRQYKTTTIAENGTEEEVQNQAMDQIGFLEDLESAERQKPRNQSSLVQVLLLLMILMLGSVIDLNNSTRYYNFSDLMKGVIKHVKIACKGRDSVLIMRL